MQVTQPLQQAVAPAVAAVGGYIGSTLYNQAKSRVDTLLASGVDQVEEVLHNLLEDVGQAEAEVPGVVINTQTGEQKVVGARKPTAAERKKHIEEEYEKLQEKRKKGKRYKLHKHKELLQANPIEDLQQIAAEHIAAESEEEEELAPRKRTTRKRKASLKVTLRKACRAKIKRLKAQLRQCERDHKSLK